MEWVQRGVWLCWRWILAGTGKHSPTDPSGKNGTTRGFNWKATSVCVCFVQGFCCLWWKAELYFGAGFIHRLVFVLIRFIFQLMCILLEDIFQHTLFSWRSLYSSLSYIQLITSGLVQISRWMCGSPLMKVTLTELSISNFRHAFTLN